MKKPSRFNHRTKLSSIRRKRRVLDSNINAEDYNKNYNKMTKMNKVGKHRTKIRKVLFIILCVLLSIVLLVSSVFAILYFSGKSQFSKPNQDISIPADEVLQNNGNIVKNNGVTYALDEDITTILCIGVDKDDKIQNETENIGSAGQADALFLACIDTKENKYTVLSINRDSIIDVDVYSTEGKFTSVKKMQACLSYAYGNGKKTSCENTSKAISRLLYNIPIDSYFSINKACIPLLNDIVYGVEVPVYDSKGNATDEMTYLEGQEAYDYIHYRDTSKIDSNATRLKRQVSYIKAFAAKVIEQTKYDLGTPLELFETVSIYSTTDLNASKITYLTTNVFSNRKDIKIDFKNVPGKVVEGENGFAEYIVDNDALLQVVLDIFYDEVKQPQTSKEN